MNPPSSRLLILSCSRRKRHEPERLPAVERYDGPFFRVVRRCVSEVEHAPVVFVLSAQFGLIAGNDPIPWYDQSLTKQRQKELAEPVARAIGEVFGSGRFTEAFICAGRSYQCLLDSQLPRLRETSQVHVASGGMGEKLTRLRNWFGRPSMSVRRAPVGGSAAVRGVKITTTHDEVMNIAVEAVKSGNRAATACHGWFVPAGEGRVSPKWLIHQLTQLPVSRFHSDDARRALTALGVPILPCT